MMLLFVGLFLIGVGVNAFFAGYETGFVACNPIRVRYKADVERDINAKRLLFYLDDPDRMISVVLVGTNLALVFGTLAITHQLGSFWATVVATPMFLIFGEIVPKSMFRLHPTRFALYFYPVIQFCDGLLAPLVVPITMLSRLLLALVGAEKRDIRRFMTSLDDMRALVDESADQGTIAQEEKDMIHSVIDLQTQTAREIMVPRIKIQALPSTAERAELIRLLQESGRTRIPIYEESVDHIIGVINAYDVLRDCGTEDSITPLIKPVMHVPDTMHLADLMKEMRAKKQTIAILTDEYGGTDGLICIEDILEEIFGEIHDEFDEAVQQIRKVGKNAFVVNARVPLEEAAEAMNFPVKDDEVDTVGGWIMHMTSRIPKVGEVIEIGRYKITILGGDATHLSKVRIEMLSSPEETEK